MRLICDRLGVDIDISENMVQIIAIEDVATFAGFIQELWEEYKGNDGGIILSNNGSDLKFGKNIEVVINPFDIDCNNKKILGRIYQEAMDIICDEKMEAAYEINRKIISLLDETLEKLPYDMDYNLDLNLQNLLKLYDLTVRADAGGYPELLSHYLNLMSKACGVKCFIFVGLRKYLTSENLENLYKDVIYDKIYLIDIETDIGPKLTFEKVAILDVDQCWIFY